MTTPTDHTLVRDLAGELTLTEKIIIAMLNNMTLEQKRVAHEQLASAGVSNEGMTRFHERRAVLQRATARLAQDNSCLLYTSPSPRDRTRSRMPSSA